MSGKKSPVIPKLFEKVNEPKIEVAPFDIP